MYGGLPPGGAETRLKNKQVFSRSWFGPRQVSRCSPCRLLTAHGAGQGCLLPHCTHSEDTWHPARMPQPLLSQETGMMPVLSVSTVTMARRTRTDRAVCAGVAGRWGGPTLACRRGRCCCKNPKRVADQRAETHTGSTASRERFPAEAAKVAHPTLWTGRP